MWPLMSPGTTTLLYIIGASVGEPPLVDSTDALSRYIDIIIIDI